MAPWDRDDRAGGQDLLTNGDEARGPHPRRQLAVVTLLVLVAWVVGVRVADDLPWAPAPRPPGLTAGVVEKVSSTEHRNRFRVGLFNPATVPVQARVLGLDGRPDVRVHAPAVRIPPRTWAQVVFSVAERCDAPLPPLVSALLVRIRATGGGGEQRVDLAEPAIALRDSRDDECRRPVALTSAALGGLWILEEDHGRWEDLAQVSLMRFTSDGRFAFDPEGQLFREGRQGYFGTWRLHGTRVALRSNGGYACPAGFREVWTTTLLEEDLLRLDIVRSGAGWCHSPPGERQVLRRLVGEAALPPPQEDVSAGRR